jgi:hypothetical protein
LVPPTEEVRAELSPRPTHNDAENGGGERIRTAE